MKLVGLGFFIIGGIYGTVASDGNDVYNGSPTGDFYQKKILLKPGGCKDHPDYPDTIQCALTGRCISFHEEFNNSECDCCGPDSDCNSCSDHSDEDRVSPSDDTPANEACKDHPDYEHSLTFQCAQNRSVCLSTMTDRKNGICDCCPNKDCNDPACTDFSDEECDPEHWEDKFTCDGKCIALSKLTDTETDCWSDCTIEQNEAATDACEANKAESRVQAAEEFCNVMLMKNTAHFRCSTGDKQCIPAGCVRDGKKDCNDGEDEDATLHPDCPATVKANKCDPNVIECVLVNNKAESTDCRCKSTMNTSTNLDNCNRDSPQRRRRLF